MRKFEYRPLTVSRLSFGTALLVTITVTVACKTNPSVIERREPQAPVPAQGARTAPPVQVNVANPNLFAAVVLPDQRGYLVVGSDGQILRQERDGAPLDVVATDTNAPLFGVNCHSETKTCIAYGADGLVLRSTDFGKKFVRIPLAPSVELRAMCFGSADPSRRGSTKLDAVVVGERGGIYTSSDDGTTFVREESGSTAFLGHVVAVPGAGAWLVAGERGEVLRSAGDGRWHRVAFPSQRLVTSLHSSSLGHVFAADDGGALFRSTDAGQSFAMVWGPEPGAFITALTSDVSGNTLLAVTRSGTVLRSTDGGRRFESVKLDTKAYLSRVAPLGTKGFMILGNEGTLFRAAADLQTFRRIPLDNAGDLEAFAFEPKTEAWLAAGKGGFIARSDDNKDAAVTQSQALLRHMNGIAFDSKGGALVAVGTDEGAMRSADGGKTWQNVPLPVANGTTMFSIAVSEKTGTLVASGTGSALLRSTDSGRHFAATRGASGSLSTVYALSDGRFLTASVDDGVLRSSDDGLTWKRSKMDPGISVVAFARTESTLIAAGLKGALFYSVDHGQSFVRSESDSEADLRAIAVMPRAVVVVGTAGAVLRSTDGGRHFSAVAVDSNANLMSVAFHPKLSAVVAVGNDGTILTSFDEGTTWLKADSGVSERLRLAFYEPGTSQIVVVGHAGALLLTKDGKKFTRFSNHTRSKLGAYAYHAPSGQFVLVGERIVGLRLPQET